ncbi:MAG: FAD-binding oxidoreductase [Pseudomonadota bacterium]|nr:FAD-binding oxidoreductase [Pseudomonadota bacterium]
MKAIPYWLDTAPAFRVAYAGPVEGRADAVVIGAGLTGVSAALGLARQGAAVAVLESGQVMGQASGRNGGHCNSGLAHDYAGLAKALGPERARAFHQAHVDAVDTVERLIREEAIDCDFHRPGRLKLAAKPEHFASLARAYEALSDVDPYVELVAPGRIREEVDSKIFYGGLLQSRGAQFHVGKFGVGLAEAAARSGARIYEQATVTGLRRHSAGGFQVKTTRGTIAAGKVLVATGATTRGPFGWFRRRIVPVGSFIVVTESLDSALLSRLLRHGRNYVTSKIIGNYFRPTPDNRLLFGGRARFAMSDPRSDAKSGRILQAVLARAFPQLAGARIDYCWGGLVDMTADRLPRAGQHDGLYYAMGYSGHGVQMAVGTGLAMAEVMSGRSDANPWRSLSWPAIPGHFGRPWFLPLVGAYYRLQDVLH